MMIILLLPVRLYSPMYVPAVACKLGLCHRWPKLFFFLSLGSILLYFDILEKIQFREKYDLNMR